jgi:dynein heavy chain 2
MGQLLPRYTSANSPSLFSLPVNVDRTVQVANSKHVITSLRTMSVAAGVSKGFDREAWSAALQPLLRAWERLVSANPQLRSGGVAERGGGSGGASNPVDAFVELEKVRGAAAVAEVDRTLSTLGRVLKGTELLTPVVFAAGKFLMEHTVPPGWEKNWEGPEEPLAYCKSVVARMTAVNQMVERVKGGSLLSKPVRLEDFFHPETFLNALRQQMARQAGVAIDNLVLVTCWDTAAAAAAGGAEVEGLRLQGAIFDGKRLADTASDAPPYVPLPTCKLAWVVPGSPGAAGPAGGAGEPPLCVPLYLTRERERAIADVQFPVFDGEETGKWVLAGAACFMGAE